MHFFEFPFSDDRDLRKLFESGFSQFYNGDDFEKWLILDMIRLKSINFETFLCKYFEISKKKKTISRLYSTFVVLSHVNRLNVKIKEKAQALRVVSYLQKYTVTPPTCGTHCTVCSERGELGFCIYSEHSKQFNNKISGKYVYAN